MILEALGVGAVALAALVYVACRRIGAVRSRPFDSAARLAEYAERLRRVAEESEPAHSDIFWDMAGHLERIRQEVVDDPRDRTLTRRFVGHHARVIVDLAEDFVALSAKARSDQSDRIERLAAQMREYRTLFARVERACLENDFDDIEMTMEALDAQIARLPFG